MNRRGFLRFLGGAGVALVASRPMKLFAAPRRAPQWPHPQEDVSPEGLRLAIEALFPAGVQHSIKAYEEVPVYGFGLASSVPTMTRRYVHQTFALGYRVPDSPAVEARLRRALYRSMYQTWAQIAERPENQGAVLWWRVTPQENKRRVPNTELDDGPMVAKLRCRASLRQTGWRHHLEVDPWMAGSKPEGMPTELLS